MSRRIIFYVIEALILTIPIGLGLFLAARAEYRFSPPVRVASVRWLLVFFLALCVIDTALGERFGPVVIPQYYVAAIVLIGGALLQTVRVLGRRRTKRRDYSSSR